jgi:photosystem II stability/assembly factor-like uncharacterized protein
MRAIFQCYLTLACVLCNALPVFSQQWDLKNPLPTNADLFDVYLLNHDTGFVCGEFQTILKTTDGGATWQNKTDPSENYLNSMAFSCRDTGFAVGWKGIMRSVNAGESWQMMPDPFPPPATGLMDIFFLDQQHGWTSGYYYTLLRTQDGGSSWQVMFHNLAKNYTFSIVRFCSIDSGFVAGSDIYGQIPVLKRTVDGGVTLTDIAIPSEIERITGLAVLNSNDLWIGAGNQVPTMNGPASCIFHTIDGGNTWTKVTLGYWMPTANEISFFDPLHGRVLCHNLMFSTSDGGITWQEQIIGDYMTSLSAMSWADTSKALVVGYYGYIFDTENGGQAWSENSQGTRANFSDICFTNTHTGYVVGWHSIQPVIYKTTDGGDHWYKTQIDTTISDPFRAVCFSDESNGWSVGYHGLMMHTTDAGMSWNLAGPATGNTYYAVNLYTSRYIWAGGHQCKMVRSVDFGNTWEDISLPATAYSITEISFADSVNGYLLMGKGEDGLMFRTTDGGVTWDPIEFVNSMQKPVLSMSIPDAETLFISIRDDGMAKSCDGGITWQSLGKIGNYVPDYLKFFTAQKGIAATGDHFIAFTSNAGETWDTILSTVPQAKIIKSHFFINQNQGWLTGWHGLIKACSMTGVDITDPSIGQETKPVVFPNPVDNAINILFDKKINQVKVYNLQGKKIVTYREGDMNVIPAGDLTPGIYLLGISASGQNFYVKFTRK